MTDRELTAQVEQLARTAGAALVGFGDVAEWAELPRAVAIALPHTPALLAMPEALPTPTYHDEYVHLNHRLDETVAQVAAFLTHAGYRVWANPATIGAVDREHLAAPFSHKLAATRAGLGWIGKCALLVTPEYGPAVRLGSVLTDAPLITGTPIAESQCGDCTICQEVCPGQAVSGENWHAGRPREEFYDAWACFRTARARSQAQGLEATLCGVCLAACPKRPR